MSSHISGRSLAAALALVALVCVIGLKQVAADSKAATAVAEASSQADGFDPAGAIDANRFESAGAHAWKGKPGDTTWWWQIRFGKPRQVGAILQVVGDDPTILRNAPKRYVWQTSSDGKEWSDLAESAVDDERRMFRIHRLKSPKTVQYLRMAIAEATDNAPTIREVEVCDDPNAKIDFSDWILPVSTEENSKLPFGGPDFIKLARSCPGWENVQAQHVWLDTFDEKFIAIEPQPLCAFLSGNLKDWCERTREPWRGTQEVLLNGNLPIWASCGGAQGLAILTDTGVDKPWDCPRCRDANNPKSPIYTHIGHTGPGPCGVYKTNLWERGPFFMKKIADDPAFASLPTEFQIMESHCGQIEYTPKGWTLIVTKGKDAKTVTQCMRRNDRPIYAAQFHIEMKGTPENSAKIMSNFLAIAKAWGGYNPNGKPQPLPASLSATDQ